MWNFLWIFLFVLKETIADEAVLLDTRTATSDVGWTMSKGSEWQEANSPHPDGSERRMLMVCQIQQAHQNNWVRTPYIPVHGAQRVHVEFEFTIRACEDVQNVATCKETFNLFYYETDSDEATSTFPPWREGDYIKVDTIAADKRFRPGSHETNFETRDIGPLTKKGIYLALQDTGACMALMHVRVYYKYCPPTTRMLATFPRTISGPEMSSLVEAEGTCVANSFPSIGDSPSLHCNSQGQWIVSKGSCSCGPGFNTNSERTKCQACGRNYYKEAMGNEACRRCPAYSHTRDYGATSCGCSFGYYRAKDDDASVACTKPPSRPVSLRATVNQTWVSLMWESPLNDGGRDDITYKVECQRCQSGYDVCTSCDEGVDYIPAKSDLVQPKVKVQDLSSFAYYKFKICALNGVSDVASGSESSNNCATATVETSQSTPSIVLNVGVSDVTDDSFLITWHAPEKSNGRIERYEVVVTTTDDVTGSRPTMVNYTRSEFTRVGGLFPNTEYLIQVRASTSVGYGPPSVPVKTLTQTLQTTPASDKSGENFSSLQLIVAIVGGSIIVLAIVIIVFFCKKKSHKKYKSGKLDPEKFPMFKSGTLSSSSVSHKTYIDPTTYEDPQRAIVDFTKEIDLGYVTIDEVIGGGEFGEVCRGKMQTPTNKDEKDVAIKTLKSGYSTQQKLDFLGEASIMGQFDHPNVIRLEGVVTRSRPLMIITEFMENGSLDAFLRIHDGEFNVIQLVGMLRNIAAGMKYLSDMGYVHRDLAARNILVNAQLICKVSDFGLSRVLEEDSDATYTTRGGKIPIRWTAPEAITYRKFTSASDVWSYGIVMWEVMSYGERPYWGMSNQDVIQAVGTGYRLPAPMDCPQVQHSLMLECWKKGRNERPKFPQIVSSLDRMLRDPNQLKAIAGDRRKSSTMTSQHNPSKTMTSSISDATSSESLGGWLESIGLGGYKENFIKNGCSSLEQIIQLNASDLSRIGVTENEHQTRLLGSLESMRQTPSYYAKNPPQYLDDGLTGIPV